MITSLSCRQAVLGISAPRHSTAWCAYFSRGTIRYLVFWTVIRRLIYSLLVKRTIKRHGHKKTPRACSKRCVRGRGAPRGGDSSIPRARSNDNRHNSRAIALPRSFYRPSSRNFVNRFLIRLPMFPRQGHFDFHFRVRSWVSTLYFLFLQLTIKIHN